MERPLSDGTDGTNGRNGLAGFDGHNGINGSDGISGNDGIDGVDGKDGKDGKDGISITDVVINEDNHLLVTLSDGTIKDAGIIGGGSSSEDPEKPDDPDTPVVPDEPSVEVAAVLKYDSTGTIVIECMNKDAATYAEIPEGVIRIIDNVFENATLLKRATLPQSLTEIGESAFRKTALKEVTLPKGLIALGKFSFGETGVEEIVIPESVTVMTSAFYGCQDLKSVSLHKNISAFSMNTFQKCTSLKK